MRHLLTTADLPREIVQRILKDALSYVPTLGLRRDRRELLSGRNVALVFFEPSTRTRLSFETAAHRLGASAVVFQTQGSSVEKGESLQETIATIEAMRFDALVIRHGRDGVMNELRSMVSAPIVSAGEGTTSHPTQALLDASTLTEKFGTVEGLRIAIVGDVRHSRVARSQVELLTSLGAEFAVCAPAEFMPSEADPLMNSLKKLEDIDEALAWCSVLSLLRIQHERIETNNKPMIEDYRRQFAFTSERASQHDDVVVIHPGPVNLGVEIDAVVLDRPNVLIHRQVTHGVAVRMAVLHRLLSA
ncbi:MAG: aspartate carbamoyltransferase catalytic subunit [Bradyrhizobiaceae bacterium]|nr:aspartate carbamoyltransferase catalytic subunit [Bradyrhizobiaceae bacterium]